MKFPSKILGYLHQVERANRIDSRVFSDVREDEKREE